MKVSVILLAGGTGSRMGTPIPKPFLSLQGKPVAHHSLEVLRSLKQMIEMIVVCPLEYRSLFLDFPVRFAMPGQERQDSVFNGFQEVSSEAEWVLVHDAARPFIDSSMLQNLLEKGKETGAATLATPAKSTLKEANTDGRVSQTLNRSRIWEIQTPQLLKKEILEAGLKFAHKHQTTCTDDVSLAELIGHPVTLVLGSYQNIKITTPEDWDFAEWYCQKNLG